MKTKIAFTLTLYAMLASPLLWRGAGGEASANNITIGTTTLNGQVNGSHTFVIFDIDWENSWRTSLAPNNWDAAWVFVKYKIDGGGCTTTKWKHATLSATDADHSVTTDNGVAATIKGVSGGTGVLMYRSADGNGSINWDAVKLRWNYATDGVSDNCTVTVKVFAIEMVYVPQGSFYVGDGSGEGFEAGITGSPFQITSEGAISLGGGGAGSLGNNNWTYAYQGDDFDDVTTQTLPAAFPKGYNAFYCMKYECSQEQFMEYLNTLTAVQQIKVWPYGVTAGSFATYWVSARNGIKCKIAPISGITDGEYVCDLDNDNNYNETNADGRYLPVDGTSGIALLSYLDWSGLRLMTELEYEKACRGPATPVVGEYAWGTAKYNWATLPRQNSGADNELASYTPNPANGGGLNKTDAILRCGIFATATSTRITAGSSYYGILELAGNVAEPIISIKSGTTRNYTGLHGNGTLNSDGTADISNWTTDRYRGAGTYQAGDYGKGKVSNRSNGTSGWGNDGIRGVRTAP